jgi:dTDP-6-deoxy-L-talose 4-dehydrogenase (NAD+)
LSPYAASKAAVYLSLSRSLEKQDVAFSWCRLFYLFGEGEDCRRLVPYIKSQLEDDKKVELTSGHQIRDFMNVSDAGKQIADVALGKNVGAINICSGIPITVRELAENIASEYGKIELIQFGVKSNNSIDPPCVVGIVGEKAGK